MIDITEAVKNGQEIPSLDLERDIMEGMMIQVRSDGYDGQRVALRNHAFHYPPYMATV